MSLGVKIAVHSLGFCPVSYIFCLVCTFFALMYCGKKIVIRMIFYMMPCSVPYAVVQIPESI